MALLNRKVDYALLILAYLHHHPAGGCARAIAGQFGLSQAFVANILKKLARCGYVASQRGVKGGYRLRRSADEIHVAELMDDLTEPFHLAECCHGSPADSCEVFGVCPIKGMVFEVQRRLRQMLHDVTLADLLAAPAEPREMPVELEVERCHSVGENV